MQLSLSLIRIVFLGLCLLFFTTYAISDVSSDGYYTRLLTGVISGFAFWCAMIGLGSLFKRFNLTVFNTATLGLFFGYLMGKAILLIFNATLDARFIQLSSQSLNLIQTSILLFSIYLGMVMTARASDELYVSIPFIKFSPSNQKKKDLLIDSTVLLDPRILDLATSGLLDQNLIIPRFIAKELYELSENDDETLRSRAKRSLETIKKLENIPTLQMRYADTDFSEIKDTMSKLVRLARLMEANIITADPNRIQQSSIESVRIINLHTLSSALKPLAQTGEYLTIKIQRYGKEPRQGIGYLEDGTMVVVNGGAEFIGENIRAQVLSVKHTSSGRMIFCNTLEDPLLSETSFLNSSENFETSPNNYFTS